MSVLVYQIPARYKKSAKNPAANGILTAVKQVKVPVPLVVRLEGTNVELGKKILQDSGLPIITADSLADAAQKVVKASQ